MTDCLLSRLLLHPRREDFLLLLLSDLRPDIDRKIQRTIADLDGRPFISVLDPSSRLDALQLWSETAPLHRLATAVWFVTLVWRKDSPLCQCHLPWWKTATEVVALWCSGGRIEWPAHPLHPVARLYEPRLADPEAVVDILQSLFLLWR